MKKSIPYIPFSLSRVLLISSCILLLIYKYDREHPKAEWDTSPEKVVISYETFGEIDYGYIPDFRVWGNGYIVWVEHTSDFTRRVFEGYLPQDGLKELIRQFVDAGFYDWFGNKNSSSENVGIQLLNRYKTNSLDANEKIAQLSEYLKSGARAEGKQFIPTVGYLYVFPIEETARANTKIIPNQWPEDKYESNFENFEKLFPNGKEITGDELDFVWEIVNRSSIIESNGKIYWIALEIPKITN